MLKIDPLTNSRHGLLCVEMNMEAESLFWQGVTPTTFLQNVYLALSFTECPIQMKHLKQWSGKSLDFSLIF